MPRITITPQTLVEHLINLQEQVDRCHSDALGFAREAGEVLLGVPPAVRPDLWTAAGLGRSNAYNYMRVARHWDTVQAAGSINRALAWVRSEKKRLAAIPAEDRRATFPLPFDGYEQCVNLTHLGVCPPIRSDGRPALPIMECGKTWENG